MPIIDDRGRVFGRLNLVDAAVAALVLVLLPAAYGAYVLFREPLPKLTAVVPAVARRSPMLQVEVRGENLRPYMRVSFNDVQGRTFLFNNPKSAVVQAVELPPGKYDVVLYDYGQEVWRLPGALTVEPLPAPPMVAVDVNGFLTGLNQEQVSNLLVGHRFPENGDVEGEIASAGPAEPEVILIKTGDAATLTVPGNGTLQLPVRVRTRCLVESAPDSSLRCTVRGVALAPGANVTYSGLNKALNLRVSDVHYPGRSRTATVRVRFIASPAVAGLVKKNDQDVGARAHPAGEMATLVSSAESGEPTPAFLRDDRVRQAIPTGRLVVVEAVLAVPVQEAALGWMYKEALVKAGAPFTFETAAYTMDGGVVEVTLPATPPGR